LSSRASAEKFPGIAMEKPRLKNSFNASLYFISGGVKAHWGLYTQGLPQRNAASRVPRKN